MPAPPAVGPGGPGNSDILLGVRKHHAGSQQLLALGFQVTTRLARRLWGGWYGCSRRSRASPSFQLATDCTIPLCPTTWN